jgi:predicted nucleotidyltransferase
MDRVVLLARIKEGLSRVFGPRFRGLILYGSEARGDSRKDSDIDLLVLLSDIVHWSKDLERIIEIVYPLEAELTGFRPIDAIPVDPATYEAQEWPLYQNVKREGIPA